ncbi:precorrin-6Y C5,15-methyltransferase (decarboxylating) subunit CbiT [Luteococcus sp. H138]|uniref:precorrin-6Y C5,15-methyltransferase (decarboxylating) subunit CbiT n=1 Tax=unclassified Luteococcus TaxID=2639923 RepID=UPI00313CF69A
MPLDADPLAGDLSPVPGRPDQCFEHDGLITKRAVRAMALAQLRPAAGELLWDVGVGSGAVAIEWALAAPNARAVGFERKAERAERARRNIARFGLAERVELRLGEAAERLAELAETGAFPDAVFIGGGASQAVLEVCWPALRPGGRIVVHGVTLETEALAVDWHRRHGGSLARLQLDSAEALGNFTAWKPARPIVQWAATRPLAL